MRVIGAFCRLIKCVMKQVCLLILSVKNTFKLLFTTKIVRDNINTNLLMLQK